LALLCSCAILPYSDISTGEFFIFLSKMNCTIAHF